MGAARLAHAFLILLLLAVPGAFLASQPAECALSTHATGSGSIDRPHVGGHCRLSEAREKAPTPMPSAIPAASMLTYPPPARAVSAVDLPEQQPWALATREPGSPVPVFIQTRTILL